MFRQAADMSSHSDAFDHWIRGSFMELNTELENQYFARADRADVAQCGEAQKTQLRDEGHGHVVALLAEGDTGDGFETAFGVLGNVGMYLAALRRHELTREYSAVVTFSAVVIVPGGAPIRAAHRVRNRDRMASECSH